MITKVKKIINSREMLIALSQNKKPVDARFNKDALWSLGLRLTFTFITFFTTVLLARLLGTTGYGIYAYVFSIISVLSIPAKFGLPPLVLRETAKGITKNDPSLVKGIWVWSGRFVGWTSLGLVAVGILLAWFWRERFPEEYLNTFMWGILLIPILTVGNLRGAALQGLRKIVQGQLPENLVRPGMLLLLLGTVWATKQTLLPEQAMLFQVIASIIAFGVGVRLLTLNTPQAVKQAPPRFENHRWWKSVLPLSLIGSMAIIDKNISTLVLGFFLPADQIGIYRVAVRVSVLASFGLQVLNVVVAPRFASLYASNRIKELQHLVTSSARVILAFNLFVTLGIALFGRWFLTVFFGSDFVVAYTPLLILLGGQLINSSAGSVGKLLNMTDHEREVAKGRAVAAILNVFLSLILIPPFGVYGAATATVLAMIVWNYILWKAVFDKMGINSLAFSLRRID